MEQKNIAGEAVAREMQAQIAMYSDRCIQAAVQLATVGAQRDAALSRIKELEAQLSKKKGVKNEVAK